MLPVSMERDESSQKQTNKKCELRYLADSEANNGPSFVWEVGWKHRKGGESEEWNHKRKMKHRSCEEDWEKVLQRNILECCLKD